MSFIPSRIDDGSWEDFEEELERAMASEFGLSLQATPLKSTIIKKLAVPANKVRHEPASSSKAPSYYGFYAEPLNQDRKEIRLVSILPDTLPEISCQIRTVALIDMPNFHALSYVWGDPNKTKNIKVNGDDIQVTQNLEAALQALRIVENGKYGTDIWIDALCINQANVEEKANQIPLMGHIYSSADHVIGWLGEGDKNSRRAFELYEKYLEIETKDSIDASIWLKMANFSKGIIRNPYWERLWIVQELCLSKVPPILLCGQNHILLDQFWTVYSTIALDSSSKPVAMESPFGNVQSSLGFPSNLNLESSLTATRNIQSIISFRKQFQESKGEPAPISDLVNMTLSRKATNPSDRVYALLGMLDEKYRVLIPVSYEKDYMDVYQDFFSAVWMSGDVAALGSIEFGLSRSQKREYPSWVPDLHNYRFRSMESTACESMSPWEKGATAKLSDDGKFVFAEGVSLGGIVSSVLYTGFELESDEQLADLSVDTIVGYFGNLQGQFTDVTEDPEPGETYRQFIIRAVMYNTVLPSLLLWETLFDFQTEGIDILPAFGLDRQTFSDFWTQVISQANPNLQLRQFSTKLNSTDRQNLESFLLLFASMVNSSCRGRKIIAVSDRIIGIAPSDSKNGDILVILHGFTKPMVLRKEQAGYYTIVGYVIAPALEDFTPIEGLFEADVLKNQIFRLG